MKKKKKPSACAETSSMGGPRPRRRVSAYRHVNSAARCGRTTKHKNTYTHTHARTRAHTHSASNCHATTSADRIGEITLAVVSRYSTWMASTKGTCAGPLFIGSTPARRLDTRSCTGSALSAPSRGDPSFPTSRETAGCAQRVTPQNSPLTGPLTDAHDGDTGGRGGCSGSTSVQGCTQYPAGAVHAKGSLATPCSCHWRFDWPEEDGTQPGRADACIHAGLHAWAGTCVCVHGRLHGGPWYWQQRRRRLPEKRSMGETGGGPCLPPLDLPAASLRVYPVQAPGSQRSAKTAERAASWPS